MVTMTDGTQPGDYRISRVVIKAGDLVKSGESSYIGSQADVEAFAPIFVPRMKQLLARHDESPREAGLTIFVDAIRLETHALRSILVGDRLHVSGRIVMWDVETEQPIGKGCAGVVNGESQGILGAVTDGLKSNDRVQGEKEVMANMFAKEIEAVLYPSPQNARRQYVYTSCPDANHTK